MVSENIELLNNIKIIIGKVYHKGASDLISNQMSIKCEMDTAYEIIALFEETLTAEKEKEKELEKKWVIK